MERGTGADPLDRRSGTPADGGDAADRRPLLELAAAALLQGERLYTADEVCARTGVGRETADLYWRAMGFPDVADDEVAFTDRDVEALAAVAHMEALGVADAAVLRGQARVMSQALATIAAAHLEITQDAVDGDEAIQDFVAEVLPRLDDLLVYLYRRHLLAAVERAVLLADAEGEAATPTLAVGFADLVGFTRLANRIEEHELAEVIERFNERAADVVAEGAGRVVKMLGDEVMFVSSDPTAAARTALALVHEVGDHDGIPPLRAGVAAGPVILRHGDVFGAPVNLAHRLVDVARPGTVVIDEGVAQACTDAVDLNTQRIPGVRRLRGFEKVRVWVLRSAPP